MSTPSVTPPVLFEDASFFAVNKPAGILVIPGRGEGTGPSLRELFDAERKTKIFVVHRLDRATSGCLLLACDRETASQRGKTMMGARDAGGAIEKDYLAVCRGCSLPRSRPVSMRHRHRTRRRWRELHHLCIPDDGHSTDPSAADPPGRPPDERGAATGGT